MRNFIRTVLNLDRRVIYSIVIFCVAGPLLMPIGLPFESKPEVQRAWQDMEDLAGGFEQVRPEELVRKRRRRRVLDPGVAAAGGNQEWKHANGPPCGVRGFVAHGRTGRAGAPSRSRA